MKLGTISLKSKSDAAFWEQYLKVMQSVLPHAQQLTKKELEILSFSIAESIKDDRNVFDTAIMKIVSAKLSLNEYAMRMHRKNIRNKGWVKGVALEALTGKLASANPGELELSIKLTR